MYEWKNYFVVQADFQHWANDKLFEALGHLKPETLLQDEGLHNRSIHHTVDYMLQSSQLWLARLQGANPQMQLFAVRHPVWRELQQGVRRETRHLQEWLESQPDSRFEEEVVFTGEEGKPSSLWVRDVLTHLFTHYAHHRAQIAHAATRLGAPSLAMDYAHYRSEVEKLLAEARKAVS